jgi:hypothetical protein
LLIATAGGNKFEVYSEKADVIYPKAYDMSRYRQRQTLLLVSIIGHLFVKASIAIWFEYS